MGVDVNQQPGLLSAFAIAQEASPGVFNFVSQAASLDWLDVETFQATDDPKVIEFDVMQKSRDTTQSTRAGIHKVMVATTISFYGLMGAQLWKCLLGNDTISGASNITVTGGFTGTAPTVGAQASTVAAMPALPTSPGTGVPTMADWVGCWLLVGTGATQEYVYILAYSAGALTTTKFQFAHPTGGAGNGAVVIPPQHIIQSNVAPNLAVLPTISSVAQFASMFEWQISSGYVMRGGIKGDARTIKADWSFCFQTIPVDPVAAGTNAGAVTSLALVAGSGYTNGTYTWTTTGGGGTGATGTVTVSGTGLTSSTITNGGSGYTSVPTIAVPGGAGAGSGGSITPTITPQLTPYTPNATEAADTPFIMRDGGLITPYSVSDTAPTAHARILSLDFELDNGLITREYGGGVQLAEVYVPGARKASIKFREDAGQYAAGPTLHTNYVKTQTSLPAYLAFQNTLSTTCFGAYFPKCKVMKYDPITAMGDIVSFDGEIRPLKDPVSGYLCRISLVNGTNAAY